MDVIILFFYFMMLLHERETVRGVANRDQQSFVELAGARVYGHAKRQKTRLRRGQVFGAQRRIEANLEV